ARLDAGPAARAAQVQDAGPPRSARRGARRAVEIDSRAAGPAARSGANALHRRHARRRSAAARDRPPARAAAPAAPCDAGARRQCADDRARPMSLVPRDRRRGTTRARRAAPRLRPALRYDRHPIGCATAPRRAAAERMGREMAAAKGTYVYALVVAETRPRLTRVPAG